MFIQTEETPNPNTLKFIPGAQVLNRGTANFTDSNDTSRSPMAARLFAINGVEGVFLGEDFISVTKGDDTDWQALKPMLLAGIMDHYTAGMPILIGEDLPQNDVEPDFDEADKEVVDQIRELLDTRVRPAVAQDGGDIIFFGFRDGVVHLRMQGACAGCPSSIITLKQGIENMLRHYIPEVNEVVQA